MTPESIWEPCFPDKDRYMYFKPYNLLLLPDVWGKEQEKWLAEISIRELGQTVFDYRQWEKDKNEVMK